MSTQASLLPFLLRGRATEVATTTAGAAQPNAAPSVELGQGSGHAGSEAPTGAASGRARGAGAPGRFRALRGTRCDASYSVPVAALSPEELERVERELTMTPIDFGFNKDVDLTFKVCETLDGRLHVPRFYGLKAWGAPCEDARTLGAPLGCEFKGALKPHQGPAVEAVVAKLRAPEAGALLVLPCGYGKTVCGLYIAATMGRRTLILCHKSFLVDQWIERARFFLPDATIGRIQQNVAEHDADIVIGMIQSISMREYPPHVLADFGTVIIDEAHHIAAPVFSRALRRVRARHVVGLSATPERKDGLDALLFWSMGDICHRIERAPERTLVSCMLYDGGLRKEIKMRDGRVSLALMLNLLVKDRQRNDLIARRIGECHRRGRHVIVLSDRIAQLDALKELLERAGVTDVGYYIGSTPAAERARAAERRVLLSTYSMAKEGLDIPRLDTLVLATPKGDVIQASGRVQRQHPDKSVPLIIDVIDTFSIFEQLRWKRWKFYRNEGFECQTINASDTNASWFC